MGDKELDRLVDAFLVSKGAVTDRVDIPVYKATDDIWSDLIQRGLVRPMAERKKPRA